jgi:peptide/nickel transport system permease protein
MIKIYEPFLNKKTLSYAHDAIDSSWISSQGYYLDATKEKDTNLVMSGLILGTLMLVVGNLIGDLLLKAVDPRIKLDDME